ncbi:CLUMA_CG006084, isoform A [Clunio marinus]|uniref:CLUMA_CG006084, isoform A n=1 Tax=Clunio marinus TaxID=568069 RepID=A0A1J1HY87_9DIPT|nr:CLUMA_CG006084, isoform A [Clunio marinus]
MSVSQSIELNGTFAHLIEQTLKLSERSPFDGSCCGGYTGGDDTKSCSSDSEPTPSPRYRVVMLGDSATGKTALVNQFMTSEYMHTYDASLDDEFGEKTVSILLDGEESEMIFIDHPASEMSVENSLSTYEPHACIIVYSIVQKSSFRCAEEILNYLWRENVTKDKAVIVVGNKADLARSRAISTTEGKQLAASRDVKFIETSSGIQHNVDELLVGILKQIRLKETREKKQSSSKMKNSRTHSSLHMAKEILQKICFSQLDISKSKSCENLHVL